MDMKNWYQSKTIISQLFAVLFFGLSISGIMTVDEQTIQQIVDIVLNLGIAVAQLYAIYGRIIATSKIK